MSLFYSSALGGLTDSVFKRVIAAKATKMKLHPRLGRRDTSSSRCETNGNCSVADAGVRECVPRAGNRK